MNIKEKREKISDIMAIYIVAPTEENMRILKNDVSRLNFDNFYINFIEKAEDNVFQNFFSDLLSTENYHRIYKITVHPISFFSFHSKVFSVNINNPYKLLNSANVKDEDVSKYFCQTAKGLYNVLFTLKTIPLVKYRSGWFGQAIVEKMQEMFSNTFEKFPEIKEDFPKKNSTLLILLERDTDLPIMFHHAASYGAMLNDIFGTSRVKVNNKNSNNKFEIDVLADYIWNEFLSVDFPTTLERIVKDFKNLNDQTSFLDSSSKKEDLSEISMKLNQTLEKVSELIEKKKVLENHINFAEKMKNEIKLRKLEEIYDFEYDLMSTRAFNNEIKRKFNKIITSSNHSQQLLSNNEFKYDIIRACLIYYLFNKDISKEELSTLEKTLVNNFNVKTSSLEFLKQKRSFEENLRIGGGDKQAPSGLLGKMKSKTFGLFSSFQSLMTIKQPSLSADILDSLSNNKDVSNFVTYNFLKKTVEKVNPTQSFNQILVFFVGGGSLAEYEYLDQLFLKNNKNVFYI